MDHAVGPEPNAAAAQRLSAQLAAGRLEERHGPAFMPLPSGILRAGKNLLGNTFAVPRMASCSPDMEPARSLESAEEKSCRI
jgi:hypothetical protein